MRTQYDAVKQAFVQMQASGEMTPFEPTTYGREDALTYGIEGARDCAGTGTCAFDLVDCSGGSDYLPWNADGSADDTRMHSLADTAYEVLRLQGVLQALGYPESAWKPQLEAYESQSIAAAAESRAAPAAESDPEAWSTDDPADDPQSRLHEALKDSLNRSRAGASPPLPIAFVEGGCGAGEVGVRIATQPADGTALFIPSFYYRLCKVRKIDPEDTDACDHWREPAEGVLMDVSGDYRYRVRWPDGHVRRGKFSFTNLEEGQTVTIRRQ